jgi:hypothetical protein
MKRSIRIGISGHQSRPGIDWAWTAARIREVLEARAPVMQAFTSLAVGSDQIFAREALALRIPVTAVIPMSDYERCFSPEEVQGYRDLLGRCERLQLDGAGSDEESFFQAGRQVAELCDLLVAVWDGKAAAGYGGTADIVGHCLDRGLSVVQIDPTSRIVRTLPSAKE